MRQDGRRQRNRTQSDAQPLDPVALTVALWLGVMVAITGVLRLSEIAAANASAAQDEILLSQPHLLSAPLSAGRCRSPGG